MFPRVTVKFKGTAIKVLYWPFLRYQLNSLIIYGEEKHLERLKKIHRMGQNKIK